MDLVHWVGLDVAFAGDYLARLSAGWFLLGDGVFVDVVIG